MRGEERREENKKENRAEEYRRERKYWVWKTENCLPVVYFMILTQVDAVYCTVCCSLVRYTKKIFGEVLGGNSVIRIQNECGARTTL